MRHFLLALLLLLSPLCMAFDGTVFEVHDGDTIKVTNEFGFAEMIRIAKIDAPEEPSSKWPYQPYANESRDALSALCLFKTASVKRFKKDRYGRTVANVSCDGIDVTTFQLVHGNAWFYRYSSGKALKTLAATAKDKQLGLWAAPAVEPYLWRKGIRQ